MSESILLNQALGAIGTMPGIEIVSSSEVRPERHAVDRVIRAIVNGQPIHLALEARAHGYPRDIKQAIQHVEQYLQAHPQPAVGVVVAPHVSAAAREILRSRNLGYWDLSGSFYLRTDSALFDIERPNKSSPVSQTKRLFTGSSELIIHALLHEHNRDWKIADLSEVAGVAPSYAHKICQTLEQQAFMCSEGAGPRTIRRLTEPGRLLDEWADHQSLQAYSVQRFYLWTPKNSLTTETVTEAFQTQNIPSALTAVSAAIRRAPFVSNETSTTLLAPTGVEIEIAAVMEKIGASHVDEGENVLVLSTDRPSPFMFKQRVDGLWLASDLQIYLDLYAWPQRGKEQAEHLRRQRLNY